MGIYGKFSVGRCLCRLLLHHVDAAGSQEGCREVKVATASAGVVFSYHELHAQVTRSMMFSVLQDSIPVTVTPVSGGGVRPGEAVRNRPHPCWEVKLREEGSH